MKTMINAPYLEKYNGEHHQPNIGTEETPKFVDYSVSQWVELMLNVIPLTQLSTQDAVKQLTVLRAMYQAQDKPGIELEDDHYTWLLKTLFDDEYGKTLVKALNKEADVKGSFALSVFGLVAIPLEEAIKKLQPKD